MLKPLVSISKKLVLCETTWKMTSFKAGKNGKMTTFQLKWSSLDLLSNIWRKSSMQKQPQKWSGLSHWNIKKNLKQLPRYLKWYLEISKSPNKNQLFGCVFIWETRGERCWSSLWSGSWKTLMQAELVSDYGCCMLLHDIAVYIPVTSTVNYVKPHILNYMSNMVKHFWSTKSIHKQNTFFRYWSVMNVTSTKLFWVLQHGPRPQAKWGKGAIATWRKKWHVGFWQN